MILRRRQLLGMTILLAAPFLSKTGIFEKLEAKQTTEVSTSPVLFKVVYTFENEQQYWSYANAIDFSKYKVLVEEFRADGRILDFNSVTSSTMSCATYSFRDRAALDSYLVSARSWASGHDAIRKSHQVSVRSFIS